MKLRQFASIAIGPAAGLAAGLAAFGAGAADRLTEAGVALPGAAFAPGGALEARIDAGDDEVQSVHTIMRPASSNILMMRDRDGFWTTWNGQRDDLIPAAAARDGDELVFKIFEAPPKGIPAMTITVAYRTPEGLKFGWFDAAEAAE